MKVVKEAGDASIWCEEGRESEVGRACRASVIMSTYNLERLVPLSVRSALAQDYADYEVVIVDDGSADASWEKTVETVRTFKGFKGVRVKCLRHAKNLGIPATFNRLMDESRGELCVWHCGDDVAHLDRVSKIVRCWDAAKAEHPDLVSATTDANRVGELEARDFVGAVELPKWTVHSAQEVFEQRIPLLGATAVYSREQYEFFGPINPAAQAEDSTMHLRTKMRGSFLSIHEPLLEYRCVGGRSTSYWRTTLKSMRKWVALFHCTYLQALKDLEKCRGEMTAERYAQYEDHFSWMAHRYDVWQRMMSDSWRERLAALKEWMGIVKREKSAIAKVIFVLPHWMVDCLCWTHCCLGNVRRWILTGIGKG